MAKEKSIIKRLMRLTRTETRAELGSALGVCRTNLYHWERKGAIPLIRAQKIADRLGVPFRRIYALNDRETQS